MYLHLPYFYQNFKDESKDKWQSYFSLKKYFYTIDFRSLVGFGRWDTKERVNLGYDNSEFDQVYEMYISVTNTGIVHIIYSAIKGAWNRKIDHFHAV